MRTVVLESFKITVRMNRKFVYIIVVWSVARKDNESVLNAKNMKRESKVYSYKEQQEELALRRELEEKRRKEGKVKEPELNAKQKEAMRIQLEKEAIIRLTLSQVTLNKLKYDKYFYIQYFISFNLEVIG